MAPAPRRAGSRALAPRALTVAVWTVGADVLSRLRRIPGWLPICGANAAATALLERVSGIDTGDPVSLEQLGLASVERSGYTPSGWFVLGRALPRFAVGRDDVFLDLGSGKGRVIYLASRYTFGRIVGVEIAEELNEVARANMSRARLRARTRDITLVTGDAGRYAIPDDVTVIYLNDPFAGETFQRVADNLADSIRRSPRLVRVVYVSPREAQRLMMKGACLERRLYGRWFSGRRETTHQVHVYSIGPDLPATVTAIDDARRRRGQSRLTGTA